jgi:hypothetical protein
MATALSFPGTICADQSDVIFHFVETATHYIGMPRTREDEIVVGRLDVAKIPSKVRPSVWGVVGEDLLLQYAVYRASSLFGITCYATRKHEIRVGLDEDLQSCHQRLTKTIFTSS